MVKRLVIIFLFIFLFPLLIGYIFGMILPEPLSIIFGGTAGVVCGLIGLALWE